MPYDPASEARQERARLIEEMRAILDRADRAGRRNLTHAEQRDYQRLESRVDQLSKQLGPRFDPRFAQGDPILDVGDVDDGSPVLGPEQRMSDWLRATGRPQPAFLDELEDPERFSVGRILRGIATSRWDGAELERRALSEGTDAAGGFLVPEPLAAQLIDRVRNATRAFQAGARTVPMTVDQLSIARLTGGASVAWKSEGSAITESNLTFDRVTFTARTLPILVKVSQELFEDLSAEAAALIENEIAAALALELDRVILRGSGTAPEPKGIRNHSGVTVQSLGANGATVTWDHVIDAVANVRNQNHEPNAILWSSRTQQSLDKTKDAQSRYLEPPSSIAPIRRFTSNQVPNNLTVGTSNDCSEIYTGRWSECLVGIRTDLRFRTRVLKERFADNLQIGLLAYLRADVQLAHGEGFNVTTGVRP